MMFPSGWIGPQVRPWSSERLMPAALPSHETNTTPSAVPPWAHGLSGALWMVRMGGPGTPLSDEVIIRMLPVVPTFRYSWQTAYSVPPPSMAAAGSPTNIPVALGIETFLPQVTPPSVETENAHVRAPRESPQPASRRPPGPAARVTSAWL